MIHSELKHIPVGAGVSEPWHHLSALLFLESASSFLSAAEMSSGGLPLREVLCFVF